MFDDNNYQLLVNGSVKSFYVRTLISYNSESDYSIPQKGLSYDIGEILYIQNASDLNWWKAVKLNPIKTAISSADKGLIPSAERLRRKYSNKAVTVNFKEKTIVIEANGNQTIEQINLSLTRGCGSIDLKRRRQQEGMKIGSIKSEVRDNLNDFYEIVDALPCHFPRPLVVLGPGRSNLYDKLIELYPDEFASPVNHTTRPRRSNEVNGVDYYFVENKTDFVKDKEAGLFVETVEYNGNYYGTSLMAVKTVIENGRHCVIDAMASVISNLEMNGIFPISILICPDSYSVAKVLMGAGVDDKLIRSSMQYSSLLNSKDRLTFAVILRCNNITDLINQAYAAVINCQKWGSWKRSEDNSKLCHDSVNV